ncbi:Outer membrane protein TolC [Algoriella xinjiangensis]|uniref:Outer membrane protein TolC n=1 Tax=Algoriella xinjiangensis TaxID=684065 RepID=A0A1I4Y2E2_9FLAO|nr:TolC family protein [Algoriella xinjiangensis]SFN31843.1 Outer membrane protein TolC [Algoriella xinjiangensis]VDH15342.1 type I secretion outer membrane protein, TolC family [Algoriella xinjiangensis]
MIFNLIRYQLLTILLVMGSFSFAQTEYNYHQLKLNQAIEIGLQNNKKLQIRTLQSNVSELVEHDLKNEKLPDVNFHTGFHVLSNINQYEDGLLKSSTKYKVPREQYDFTLSAEIPIYMGGKLKNEEKKAAIETDISKLRAKKDERELRMQIITAYLQVLHLQEQQSLLLDKIHEDSINIKQVKSFQNNGLVTYNEVLRTELQLSNHKMSFTELANDVAIIEHQIKTLIALPEEQELQINTTDLFTNTAQIGFVDELIIEAFEKSESLQIAKKDLYLKEIDKKITKSNILPRITADGEYGLNYPNFMFFPPEENLYRFGKVGINIVMPLSNLYKNKQKMLIADRTISIAKLEIEEKEEQLSHDVFVANRRLEEAVEKIEIAREAIAQSKENYRIVKTKYANKLSLITELIDADNVYLEAQSNLISLEINKQLKYYQLQYVIGNL